MYIYILKYFVPGWNIVYFIVAEVFDKINNQTLFFFFSFKDVLTAHLVRPPPPLLTHSGLLAVLTATALFWMNCS